jgi:alkanesulfonate monooxygenase SsuD/methylene tetrahydromethanopterin reductase-like flavin-dependent oxidoreductase (luciferase family)
MDIGIGLPNAVRGVDRGGILDWAKRAEEAGFASLGTLDRIAYPNYESLICLAAAAFHARGRLFESQLRELTDFWAGDVVGPEPANGKRPGLLIGGTSERAYRRAAQYADGWTMGGGTPEMFSDALTKLRDVWSAAPAGKGSLGRRCSRISCSVTTRSTSSSRASATTTASSGTTRSGSFNRPPRTRTRSRPICRRSSKPGPMR